MKIERRVFEVKQFVTNEETKNKYVFEKKGDIWVYHAPNAQDHTIEELSEIMGCLEQLHKEVK